MEKNLENAVLRGDFQCTRFYLQQLKRLDETPEVAGRIFVKAVEGGHLGIVKFLLDESFPDKTVIYTRNDKGELPIHIAKRLNYPLLAAFLHETNLQIINSIASNGKLPIMNAILEHNYEALFYILESNADIDPAAMEAAIQTSNTNLIELLAPKIPQETLTQHLLDSIQNQLDIEIVKRLIQSGADVNVKNAQSLLHIAANRQDWALVDILLDAKANPYAADTTGATPIDLFEKHNYQCKKPLTKLGVDDLFAAISFGNVESVKNLLETASKHTLSFQKCNELNSQGDSVLAKAVELQNQPIIDYLMQAGANVCKVGPNGQTPLTKAVANNDVTTCKLLLSKGAALTVNTALSMAIQKVNLEIVELLVENGAETNRVGKNGNTPLIESILCKSLDIAKYLIGKGAYCTLRTPVQVAMQSELYPAVQLFLEQGLDGNFVLADGRSLLTTFISISRCDLVEYLIGKGADVNRADVQGTTPLNAALALKERTIFNTLLKHDVKITGVNTKLLDGIDDETMQQLLDNGLNVNTKIGGDTLLVKYVTAANIAMVEFLLTKQADVNIPDVSGTYLVEIFLQEDNFALFNRFVEHGADLQVRSQSGESLLSIAAARQNFAAIELLILKKADVREAMGELQALADVNTDFAYYLEKIRLDKCAVLQMDDSNEAAATCPEVELEPEVYEFEFPSFK